MERKRKFHASNFGRNVHVHLNPEMAQDILDLVLRLPLAERDEVWIAFYRKVRTQLHHCNVHIPEGLELQDLEGEDESE